MNRHGRICLPMQFKFLFGGLKQGLLKRGEEIFIEFKFLFGGLKRGLVKNTQPAPKKFKFLFGGLKRYIFSCFFINIASLNSSLVD